jgi:hypothetical protein
MQLRKDFWRCAIVGASLPEIVSAGFLEGWPITWLPDAGDLRYLADPFGLWRDGRLYVFAEHFDYRDAIGRIVVVEYDDALRPIGRRVVLREPWHLSYPFVFEAAGETWLLPEAYQSGGLWLYRATHFPERWERAGRIELDQVPLDASPFHDGTRWWLFYAPAFPAEHRLTHLCAAYADDLTGPWRPFAGNPFFVDANGARPGGTPFIDGGTLHLPLQVSAGTYGAALKLLRIDRLDPERIEATPLPPFGAPAAAAPFTDGCHTLSAAGPVTLIDVKQTRFSAKGLAVRPFRAMHRRRLAAAGPDW